MKECQAKRTCSYTFELFTIRSNLNFKPEFTSKGFEEFQQKIKLPPVGVEPTTLTITGLRVQYLAYCAKSLFGCQSESLTPS